MTEIIKTRKSPLSWPMQLGDKASAVLFAAIIITIAFTFRDYGYSYDEAWHNRWNGQAVLKFFLSGGKDLSATTTENFFHLYGGTFDIFAELLVKALPWEPRNARHLANVLAGVLCIAGTWRTARHIGGHAAGFWATLFLISCAPFYGHMFINAKDIPFAAGYVWSLYWLIRVSSQFPKPPLRDRLWLGITLGLSLGVRIGGVLIVFYYALLVLSDLAKEMRSSGSFTDSLSRAGQIASASIPILLVGFLLMVAFWPAAMLSPLSVPLQAFEAASNYHYKPFVYWAGREISSADLPWNYLPVLFGVELPEILAILFPSLIIYSCYHVATNHKREHVEHIIFFLFASLFPIAWAILNNSVIYDNARHFLFVLPPLCIVSSYFFDDIYSKFRSTSKYYSICLISIVTITLSYSTLQMATLHPYEYAYKNAFSGGIPGGQRNFDTDYWYTAYREAAALVYAHARQVAAATNKPFDESTFIVAAVGNHLVLDGALPKQFQLYVEDGTNHPPVDPDYLIATTRWNGSLFYPSYPVIGTVGRRGMTFAVIKASPKIASIALGSSPANSGSLH